MNVTLDLTSIFFVVVALLGAVYAFYKPFRDGVNQVFRVTIGRLFSKAVSPIDRQKDQYQQAVALLKQQKEAVVKVTATATLENNKLTQRQAAVDKAVADYTRGRDVLKLSDAELNTLAGRVAEAKKAVETQKATVEVAKANVDRATASLARTTKSIQQFAQNIQDNEGKLALAEALNIQAKAEELAGSINDVLSQAGQANAEIDRILAEAEARAKMSEPSDLDKKLEQGTADADAAAERARLDAELGKK